jgi:hypothetical protein
MNTPVAAAARLAGASSTVPNDEPLIGGAA